MPILCAIILRQSDKIGPRPSQDSRKHRLVDGGPRYSHGDGAVCRRLGSPLSWSGRVRQFEFRLGVYSPFHHSHPRLAWTELWFGKVLHNPEDAQEILGTTLTLRTGGSLLGLGISIATLRLIQPHDRQALLLVSILSLTLVFQAFDTIDCFFQSQVRSKITVWAKNGAFLIFAVIRVFLIYAKEPLWTFAVAMTGETVLGAAGLVLGYRLSGGKILSWRSSRKRASDLLQQSWPVIFSSMAIMVYMRPGHGHAQDDARGSSRWPICGSHEGIRSLVLHPGGHCFLGVSRHLEGEGRS